jgi:hypothetical protein
VALVLITVCVSAEKLYSEIIQIHRATELTAASQPGMARKEWNVIATISDCQQSSLSAFGARISDCIGEIRAAQICFNERTSLHVVVQKILKVVDADLCLSEVASYTLKCFPDSMIRFTMHRVR